MSKQKKGKKKMFVSVLPGEQVEVAMSEDGKLTEYYVEIPSQTKTKGNIYKGKIHNIDRSLQAAFINYGAEKNGFLQVDEVHPEYYQGSYEIKKGFKYPPLQKVLKPGQEMLVQVVKEPAGTKGAFLTTYLSIPGRHFVLTPGREQMGISRKIEDEKERARLRKILDQLSLDSGLGAIVRTASVGENKTSLNKDLQFLKRLWKEIRKKGRAEKVPALIYEEKELVVRSVRDYLTEDVIEVWVDDAKTAEQIKDMVVLTYPRKTKMVRLHDDPEHTLWERFNLKRQIEQIYEREVTLPSGGRLIFDQAEALTAVDINSGKIGGEASFKEMALKTNMEAAAEIANQLRLRDMGGQVVIDFIEMKDKKHCLQVERQLRAALKTDRARTEAGRLSRFGLLQLVRQRLGASALSQSTEPCPCCNGIGLRRTLEWRALAALKEIHRLIRRKNCPDPLVYRVDEELSQYILNHKRERLLTMEKSAGRQIHVTGG